MDVRLEFATHMEIAISRKAKIVSLILETKKNTDDDPPSRFQCALRPGQAIRLAQELQGAAQDLGQQP